VIALAGVALFAAACGGTDKKAGVAVTAVNPAKPRVAFVTPVDGATVRSPVTLTMTAMGLLVEPVDDGSIHPGAGHLHVMIDARCLPVGSPIPKDEAHVHFGKPPQQTGELTLSPGPHTLCLQAGDGSHTALGITQQISITVVG
jgi:hypothetical protein